MTMLEIPIADDDLAWFDEQAMSDGYENARDYFGALLRLYVQRRQLPTIDIPERIDLAGSLPQSDEDNDKELYLEYIMEKYSDAENRSKTPLTDSLTGVLSEDAISDNWRDDYVKHILEKHA